MIGPPVGGGLYAKLGYRAPFIFSIVCTILDLIGRILVIERKDALLWGIDPAADIQSETSELPPNNNTRDYEETSNRNLQSNSDRIRPNNEPKPEGTDDQLARSEAAVNNSLRPLSLFSVISRLFRSPRALAALFIVLTYG